VGQPGCGHRLPQPGQLTIGEELLGYHNNNNIGTSAVVAATNAFNFGLTYRRCFILGLFAAH